MSKAALKKTLALLSPEQKDQLLLDLYSARKEAKEYLDFFVDPDIEKLVTATCNSITREVYRKGKHGYNKPRITEIRNLIKKVATLNPGPEYVIQIMVSTIQTVANAASIGFWYTNAVADSFARITRETLIVANDAAMLDATLNKINTIVDAMPNTVVRRASRFMRAKLKDAISDGLSALTSAKT